MKTVVDPETETKRVLVVDDERDLAESCAFFLQRAGLEVELAFSGEDALTSLDDSRPYHLVLTDLKMPRMTGIELLREIKRRDPDIEVVVITGYPEVETAVEAMRHGALDYLTKPFKRDELMECVEKALAHRGVRRNNRAFGERLRRGSDATRLVADATSAFAKTVETVERAAQTDASVLIQGESGTGKELLAHHLHESSARAGRPFVPVDCATMPENLVESELFGHVRGAFSGAENNKMGLFQVADGGTLFLDEIGELPLAFQTKFLRAIQERKIRRVGGNEMVSVDVRIVAATNRDLAVEVEAGRFRADLFYRLDVVRIDVPPLRERPLDIEPLVCSFLAEFCEQNPNSGPRSFTRDAMAAMQAYDWPGNVRQLKNVVERACTLGDSDEVGATDLPEDVRLGVAPPDRTAARDAAASEPFQEMKARKIAAIESSYLISLLEKHAGNVTRCAAESGMSRSAFQKIMQRYEIRSRDYRPEDGSSGPSSPG